MMLLFVNCYFYNNIKIIGCEFLFSVGGGSLVSFFCRVDRWNFSFLFISFDIYFFWRLLVLML